MEPTPTGVSVRYANHAPLPSLPSYLFPPPATPSATPSATPPSHVTGCHRVEGAGLCRFSRRWNSESRGNESAAGRMIAGGAAGATREAREARAARAGGGGATLETLAATMAFIASCIGDLFLLVYSFLSVGLFIYLHRAAPALLLFDSDWPFLFFFF